MDEHLAALQRALESNCLPDPDRALLAELLAALVEFDGRGKGGGLSKHFGKQVQSPTKRDKLSRSALRAAEQQDKLRRALQRSAHRQPARAVLVAWCKQGTPTKLNEQDLGAIEALFEVGFTEQELLQAVALVQAQPELIPGRVSPPPRTMFRSAKRVRKWLGIPEPSKCTWLSPFDEPWRQRYGGPLPYGQAAKVLRPLVEAHGVELVLQRYRAYLAVTDAAYVSLPKFAATFGTWGAQAQLAPSSAPLKITVE